MNSRLKVLHIVSQDNGGAGRATIRLHQALLHEGVESLVLTQNKTTDLSSVIRLAKSKKQKVVEKIRPILSQIPLLVYPKRNRDLFSPNGFSNKLLIQTIKQINPDILHLHWINNGFFSIKDLREIKIPILWSIHDENTYTGGCHVVESECIKFKTKCNKCPFLKSNFSYDLSYRTFNIKAKTYAQLNLTINGLSKWIASRAKESALLKDQKIINLPNPIDTNIYKPISKQIARDLLGINNDFKIISFGAISGTNVYRKGYHHLKSALKLLNKTNIHLIVFGASDGDEIEGIPTTYLGHLYDDISLRIVYSASDVFVTPSLAENLSNAIIESLSCGTPIVAFDIGGNGDMIDHKINGYLANNVDDMAKGIQWILESTNYETLSRNAREKAINNFDSKIVAKRYINEYKKLYLKEIL